MSSLEVHNVVKRYGQTEVLTDINISIDDGEFLVLVGPSGCGKSTLLNIIAGLEPLSDGRIMIAGQQVNDIHPKDRDIAMVFQSYALYPNMTVRNNITFGLKMRKTPTADIAKALDQVAELLQITPLLDRKPSQLSGGQRQRVAMGRALVRDPKIFLFDEPLSNLDAKLRVEMRTEIKKLHQRLGATIVYVTHDQIEAMTLATRIAVMRDGLLQQFDTPQAIYDHPANTFVASFMGSPAMNLIPCALQEKEGQLHATLSGPEEGALTLKIAAPTQALKAQTGSSIILGLRPEAISDPLSISDAAGTAQHFSCVVDMTEPTGPDTLTVFSLGGIDVTARMDAKADVKPGQEFRFAIDLSKAVFFNEKTGLAI